MAKITVNSPRGTETWETDNTQDSLLDLAFKYDFPLEHECCAGARCSTCRVRVDVGEEHLSDMEDEEADMLDKAGLEDPWRLGCQVRPTLEGDIVIHVDHLDPHH